MKYRKRNNKNSLEIMNEVKDRITDEFDANDYLEEEFYEEKPSKNFFGRKNKEPEYEYIIDEDFEEIKEELKAKKKIIKDEVKEIEKEEKEEVKSKLKEAKEEKKEQVRKVKAEKKEVKSKERKTKKENKKTKEIVVEEVKEEPKLIIEPIRTVTKEEYKDIVKQREEERKRMLEDDSIYKDDSIDEDIKSSKSKAKLIVNTIFALIIIIIIIITVDIISVSRYGQGPYFAINTATYKDGGTKVYHGLGYKVIKYNQLQGRRDTEIGTWALKYNIEPITISDIDMAIEFNNNEVQSYDNYYKKFVRINSKLKKINNKKHTITIGYEDEGGKYTMDIICKMANKNIDLRKEYEVGKEITILGTIDGFSAKSSIKPITLKISNCFAEQ